MRPSVCIRRGRPSSSASQLVEDVLRRRLRGRHQRLDEIGLHQLGQPGGVQAGQTGHKLGASR
ncbi:Uncharacterised protein [Bordetella pertussis]|nr:Uncharacterised protein [Bordetella pertussis]